MSDVDMWDDTGAFEYRILPESGLDAFFTEERDMLMITHELGSHWLGETRVAGQTPYDTLAEAKAAGDEQIAELEAKQDAELLKEAGLDAAEWRISYRDGLRLERIDGTAGIVADENAGRQRWDAYGQDDDPVATGVATVAEALAAIGSLQPA